MMHEDDRPSMLTGAATVRETNDEEDQGGVQTVTPSTASVIVSDGNSDREDEENIGAENESGARVNQEVATASTANGSDENTTEDGEGAEHAPAAALPLTDERRQIVRKEVLAEIFPARKKGENLRFDSEASAYVIETAGANETVEMEVDECNATPKISSTDPPEDEETKAATCLQHGDSEDEEDGAVICSICLEPIIHSKVVGMCPHVYHCECLLEWTKRENHDSCPTCRRPLWDSKVYKSLETDVLDRLGIDPHSSDPRHAVVDEMIYEPEGAVWRYFKRSVHVLCCLLVILFFAQALLPNAFLSGKQWS